VGVLGTLQFTVMEASARGHTDCSRRLHHRNAQQTIEEHLALMQAGKLEEAMCDYAEDAVVVMPGQVIQGRANISTGLSNVTGLIGGAVPEVKSITVNRSVVMLTFSVSGVPCAIPDGSDTYIIEKGQIVTQTVHDTFKSAPGVVCPAAAPGQ
jgi:hypothetical protein